MLGGNFSDLEVWTLAGLVKPAAVPQGVLEAAVPTRTTGLCQANFPWKRGSEVCSVDWLFDWLTQSDEICPTGITCPCLFSPSSWWKTGHCLASLRVVPAVIAPYKRDGQDQVSTLRRWFCSIDRAVPKHPLPQAEHGMFINSHSVVLLRSEESVQHAASRRAPKSLRKHSSSTFRRILFGGFLGFRGQKPWETFSRFCVISGPKGPIKSPHFQVSLTSQSRESVLKLSAHQFFHYSVCDPLKIHSFDPIDFCTASVQLSCNCCATVVQLSCSCRAVVVQLSCNCRAIVVQLWSKSRAAVVQLAQCSFASFTDICMFSLIATLFGHLPVFVSSFLLWNQTKVAFFLSVRSRPAIRSQACQATPLLLCSGPVFLADPMFGSNSLRTFFFLWITSVLNVVVVQMTPLSCSHSCVLPWSLKKLIDAKHSEYETYFVVAKTLRVVTAILATLSGDAAGSFLFFNPHHAKVEDGDAFLHARIIFLKAYKSASQLSRLCSGKVLATSP